MADSAITLSNLTCEYLRNPLGIDIMQPRLSWRIESQRRGEMQTAYQVEVASEKDALISGSADLWNSGKVESDTCAHVPYAGKLLHSDMECWWRVRVWDRDDLPSNWSEPALWTMGLLEKSDWKAKWIARDTQIQSMEVSADNPKSASPTGGRYFRRNFAVNKPVKTAYAHICGLGFFELRLNGNKVGDAVLEPGFTRYDSRVLYVTYNVTAMLKSSENALGVILANGWFNCEAKDAWDFQTAPWRQTPRMIFQMHLEYEDGSTEDITSDGTWKSSDGPITASAMRNGETYDARLEMPGWDNTGFSDSRWDSALEVDGPNGILVAQKTLPNKVMKTVKPVKMTEPKPGIYVFDMGQNLAGWCRLNVSGPAGTTVTLKHDERLNDDGTVNQANDMFVYAGPFQTDSYTLKGEGVEVWKPRFSYSGFQYVQMEGFPGKPDMDTLTACVVHAAFDSSGEFECSNELINAIQRNALWSYIGNFADGYPADCPHREKNGWTGDAQLAAEMGFYNFCAQANYTKWMDDFADVQREQGDLPGIVPTGGWGYDIGPAWDSAYLMIPWQLYLYTGDMRVLFQHYDGFKRYVDYLTGRAEDNIISYGLGDWCPPIGEAQDYGTPTSLTATAYYYADAMIVAEVARKLGKKTEADEYCALAKSIRKSFNDKFYSAELGIYESGEQTALACALYFGLVLPGEERKVLTNLFAEVEKHDGHIWCGILGTKFVPQVLTDAGRADVVYKMAAKRSFPSWGHWIEQGATTLWEHWDGTFSRNHIMFGDISAWFYKALAGINFDPNAPGFKQILLRPNPVEDLTWVKGHHVCAYGRISSSWKREGNRFLWEVEIPANATAAVYVPTSNYSSVTESGMMVEKAEGVEFRHKENGYAVLLAQSGKYSFASEL